ncbi:unnamed protein product [Didymodactylos carnosus]|uniref:Uncharacterized protein n=1 Tax=Didymodactylos carnosus TaxID=1234261 RepID=A0A814AJ25_9BILA|nr:unnamed protein product [Didymodactylos carnosus]CAF1281129.1 unnamed protein product [Didymodactylos carnosus]CAF3696193.1 unnamed protein product [Didymodactylos carnosus]CAF4085906.1 unnamed protein product [Didymodactylos carnosus]
MESIIDDKLSKMLTDWSSQIKSYCLFGEKFDQNEQKQPVYSRKRILKEFFTLEEQILRILNDYSHYETLPKSLFNLDWLGSLLLLLLEHSSLTFNTDHLISSSSGFDHHLSSTATINNEFVKSIEYTPNLSSISWSSEQLQQYSSKLLDLLFKLIRVSSLQQLLLVHVYSNQKQDELLLSGCFHLLTPFLMKSNYEIYPVTFHCFVLLVRSIYRPLVSDYIHHIFPGCLIALDDYRLDMKIIGLYLLNHLYEQCTSTDLTLFNRSNVVSHALEHNLHVRQTPFIEYLLLFLFKWLSLIEPDIYCSKHQYQHTSLILERLIQDTFLETTIKYRQILIHIIQLYIERLQLFTCRHLKQLIDQIDDCMENRQLRYMGLKLMKTIFRELTPRINTHRNEFMKIIVRCIFKHVHEQDYLTQSTTDNVDQLLITCACELNIYTDNYVIDAIKTLINVEQLEVRYRDKLDDLLMKVVKSKEEFI